MKLFENVSILDYPWNTLTMANWRKYPNDLSTHVLSVDILSREVDPVTGVLRTERLLCCKQSAPSFLRTIGLPIPEVAYFHEISELDPVTKQYTAKSINMSMRSIMSVRETCIYKELSQLTSSSPSPSPVSSAPQDPPPSPSNRSFLSSLLSWSSPASSSPQSTPSSSPPASAPSFPPSPSSSAFSSSFSSSPSAPSAVTQFIQQAEFHATLSLSTLAQMLEDAAASRFAANAQKGRRALEMVIEKVIDEARSAASAATAAVAAE